MVLPASSFFEKTGTYTNTDRRVQIGREAATPPGKAARIGLLSEPGEPAGYPMNYGSIEAVFAEFASLTQSYRGLTYEQLSGAGKLWPIEKPGDPETPVLFHDRFRRHRAAGKFVPCRV